MNINDLTVLCKWVLFTAPPEFLPNKEPQETSFPKNSDAVFHCEASSHNSHKKAPVWLVNSRPLIGK